jgi:K+-transporting ATPase ATPase C chain
MITMLWRQTATGLRLLVVFTVLLGILYPLATFAVAHLPGLADKAEGSLTAGGSSLIGIAPVPADPARDPYFHPRPSASAQDVLGPTDTTTSGGSNKSGFNPDLLDAITQRREQIAAREGVAPGAVPPDAVTASASGLDPHISPEYAALQVVRVARVTGLPVEAVQTLVAEATNGRVLGFLGEPTVNVTELNLAVAGARK